MSAIPTYQSDEVFGVSGGILECSYVDRGELDTSLQRYLSRNVHVALRGESKCGKSWLRQKALPDAIIVQCRLGKSVADLYGDALSQLGIKLVVEQKHRGSLKGTIEATQDVGLKLFAKLGFKQSLEADGSLETSRRSIGHDISDLRYIAEIIIASGRRLVIEDFHYLKRSERAAFSFDLKALWDYKCFVVLIGIWVENNLLTHLNPDLTGRVQELSIYWSKDDLLRVIDKGSAALRIEISSQIKELLTESCFGTVGIMQKLVLEILDKNKIDTTQAVLKIIDNKEAFDNSAMEYAEQLNGLYQSFSKNVSGGIRTRANSTGIYAHMLSVIVHASDEELSQGLTLNEIYARSHAKQSRIQKGNLKTVLEKLDGLQIDEDGRGLIITYDDYAEEVSVVDKQLLLYRKYATVKWLWDEEARQADEKDGGFEADNSG